MTLPTERDTGLSRKAALAKARQSRRPSRLGHRAGTAGEPDYVLADNAGFPGLLERTWQQAAAAPDLPAAVDTLLTLAGHVPADIQLRALPIVDECALNVLFGVSWRGDGHTAVSADNTADTADTDDDTDDAVAFFGEIGLNTSGRVVVRVPSKGPLSGEEDLVGGVLRVPWSAQDLSDYQAELARATARLRESVADCREWLAAAGQEGRQDMLANLLEAASRTAPFVLYSGDRQYTNFRDRNTLTGKTLWQGHPDCTLSSLAAVPLELWSDNDVLMVVCLTLLVRSAGYARIEEANGTQLTIDHVAHLLERTRVAYNNVPGGQQVPPATTTRVAELDELAQAIARRRQEISGRVQLYREIHGPLMHKIERIAGEAADDARRLEARLCEYVRDRLPVSGDTLDELGTSLEATPGWLAEPRGEFGTGLEALVYETVCAATTAFEVDFAMSRGMRSLTALIEALRAEEWAKIAGWDIPHFFCCVVPAPQARRHFDDSSAHLADITWSIAARMQYNSWHFLVGNLPQVPEIAARDYFVPPTIPDIAYYSDQHHRGHVAAKVRFSIRSPQAVQVLDRTFDGFADLRLLRCEGVPFDEQDLLAAHRTSGFIAKATTLAAGLVADGSDIEITKFDPQWYWETIAE
ncbi:hypothetical protein EF847_07840 [Actinobacteria bacterium YIM 96077]|uniref:Uncharacterized protein n=1 Tax=Phytoactinopolyspora halophila TaxID=1981511 RepID=A0A329QAU2_9ACTN|nr:hypothetical protein [Phytoactinopolyspora halophila]AYY12636.1 hypothetical protein EF847_07840 [Actinobacteria bacterium YIM 96077]RAW09505.1 hypothetical protein DPM12_20915 [Phytoactinopolyspora halophila]